MYCCFYGLVIIIAYDFRKGKKRKEKKRKEKKRKEEKRKVK